MSFEKKSKTIGIEKLDDGYILEDCRKRRAIGSYAALRAAVDEYFEEITKRLTHQDSRVHSFRIEMSFEENPIKNGNA